MLRASCVCTAPLMLRAGVVVCATCGAGLCVDVAIAEYSTVRLPSDARNAAAFNRACKAGRVAGAEKRGRVWICSRDAWEHRTAAPAPRIAKPQKPILVAVDEDLLEQYGAKRAG